jgi:hypothetical protein
MSFLEPIELPKPQIGPAFMVGAASPLWGYFSTAAMGGIAYWWMTRWTQAVNLEALFGAPAKLAETLSEVTTATVEAAAEVVPPLGGEAAPVSPIAALVEPEPAVEVPEPVVEPPAPEPEPAMTAPVEPATFAEPETAAAPAPKSRKPAPQPPAPSPDA